ncbi:hypothetical protein LCGC14_2291640 [marine sediment metagenome]|uniref:Uncharacterized protein n=1 Tax=marine sediment metagenome TaxID=412755 RepID=A0A0F9F3M5_9ZZZZ
MALSDYQYSILSEMGLPIWRRRDVVSKSRPVVTELSLNNSTLKIFSTNVRLICITDTALDSVSQQRLFSAICKSVSLSIDDVTLMTLSELTEYDWKTATDKVTIAMLAELGGSLNLHSNVTPIQLPSFTNMETNPALKAKVWTVLKNLKLNGDHHP